MFSLKNTHAPIHALFEYMSFIALVGSLFVFQRNLIEADPRKQADDQRGPIGIRCRASQCNWYNGSIHAIN